jgi:putative membrane protein
MTASDGWRSLHPLSPLVNLLPRLLATARGAWPLALALIFGRGGRIESFDLGLLVLPLGVAIVGSAVHWATLRWRVIDGRLEIRTGLFVRQMRVIAADRVQHVASIQRLTHRLVGLVEIEVETAAGREVEGLLSALSRADADALVAGLRPAAPARPDTRWFANDVGDLFRFGATGTRWGIAFAVFGAGFELAQWQDPDRLDRIAGALGALGAVAAIIALLTGTWLVSTALAVVRHWGFALVERGDALVSEEGLFTRRRVEIRPGKVQLVAVHEPWLRRLAGVSSVVVSTAAARTRAGGTEQAEAMVPAVSPEAVPALLHRVLPEIPLDLPALPREPADPRARIRALAGAAFRWSLLAALIALLARPWGALAFLGVPVAVAVAELGFRAQRWAVTPALVVAEGGWLRRTAVVVSRSKVQAVWLTAGPFLRRRGLARLTVAVAGGQLSLPILDARRAVALAEEIAGGPGVSPSGSAGGSGWVTRP